MHAPDDFEDEHEDEHEDEAQAERAIELERIRRNLTRLESMRASWPPVKCCPVCGVYRGRCGCA